MALVAYIAVGIFVCDAVRRQVASVFTFGNCEKVVRIYARRPDASVLDFVMKVHFRIESTVNQFVANPVGTKWRGR